MQGSWVASGNIAPSRFVKIDTANVGKVLQAGTGVSVYGVSQEGTRNPGGTVLNDDGNAAIAGENLRVYIDDEECWLEAGGSVTAGDYLKPDNSGRGVTSSSDGDIYGAIALQGATGTGLLMRVKVVKGAFRGA